MDVVDIMHVVYMRHKRLVRVIEMCEILCLQVMATFVTHLGLLCFLMCTSGTNGFFQSQLVVDGIAIKGYNKVQ